MALLIDTSGWVDYLRSRAGALGDRVQQSLLDGSARLCSVTVAELLHGVKGAREQKQLELLFDHVPCLPVVDADWPAAGRTLHALRGKGLTLPLTDVLIAAVARRNGLPVLTIDEHFRHLPVDLA